MDHFANIPANWKSITSVDEAKILIDVGMILKWREMTYIRKQFGIEDQKEIIRHFALRLSERLEHRLSEEILVESILTLLANSSVDDLLGEFLSEILAQPNYVAISLELVQIAVAIDTSLLEHGEDIAAMGVAVVCELGLFLNQLYQSNEEDFKDADKLLTQISTYLLSVSNSSNSCIRLSLMNYFGRIEPAAKKQGLNRIMGRFGYTVLEQLFTMLFNKKTEAVSLQYLLENTPYILEGDNHCQKIIHETWKFYLLKKPERFILYICTQADFLNSLNNTRYEHAKMIFLQHLHVLLRVLSEINHKGLSQEIITIMLKIESSRHKDQIINEILTDKVIRTYLKDIIVKMKNGSKISDTDQSVKASKRGRKPSFSRVEDCKTIHQIAFLGQQHIARAS
ncbi:MAG: hypothetical protein HQK54_02035 [Oligoflexales bacterium]|nr:hypothetical protein [Oligoflexales bacterium]